MSMQGKHPSDTMALQRVCGQGITWDAMAYDSVGQGNLARSIRLYK